MIICIKVANTLYKCIEAIYHFLSYHTEKTPYMNENSLQNALIWTRNERELLQDRDNPPEKNKRSL